MEQALKKFFKNKTILITGGTGSWGSELVRQLIENYNPHEIRIYSRGEHKQVEMRRKYASEKNIRYIIGDVRDKRSLGIAMFGVDIVFNMAALKHVPVCEENVWEAVQTNIHGVQNIIEAAMACGVQVVVQVSTDKAVDPLNLYGYTKGVAERLITSANSSPSKPEHTKFVCVRGGNVLNTTGSVVPLFKYQIENFNEITLTSPEMSRYFMRVEEAIGLVLKATLETVGGEVFVMKMPGAKIIELAEVMIEQLGDKKTKIKEIGIRAGEKMYEVLVSRNESPRTVEDGDYHIILPDVLDTYFHTKKYSKFKKATMEEYNSRNAFQLDKKGILNLLRRDGWFKEKDIDTFSDIFSPLK